MADAPTVDVLAIGAHPDDVELGCAGLLLSMRARGYRFGILDLTAGEKGSRGDKPTRMKEAKAAAEVLGASARVCLEWPDTKLAPTETIVRSVAEQLRRWRPALVVSMSPHDHHPDHAATAHITARATFLAALQNFEADGDPWRVGKVIRYSRHAWFEPSFVVDITDHVEKKLEAIACYESQFTRKEPGAKTPISAPDYEEDLKAFWRHHGRGIGALYAEPFAMDGPPALLDPIAALCRQRRDVR